MGNAARCRGDSAAHVRKQRDLLPSIRERGNNIIAARARPPGCASVSRVPFLIVPGINNLALKRVTLSLAFVNSRFAARRAGTRGMRLLRGFLWGRDAGRPYYASNT